MKTNIKFRKDHPRLKTIIIEDSLSSNAPHIKDLERHKCSYILGAKEGDHKFLFDYAKSKIEKNDFGKFEHTDEKDIKHKFHFLNQVPLNESNQDVLVNFIKYWEEKPNGKKQHFSWVTDIKISTDNVYQIMRGGRARWKIENETFNTLKNQGYNFEHNFGHGNKNLSTVFAYLLMLAFLVDQIQLMACGLFKAVLKKIGAKIYLWEKLRALFFNFNFHSMEHLLRIMLHGHKRECPITLENST